MKKYILVKYALDLGGWEESSLKWKVEGLKLKVILVIANEP